MTIGPYAPCCPLKYPCMCIYMLGSSWLAGSTRIIDWFSSSIKRLRKCWASSWRHKNGIVHSCMLWVVSLGAPFKHFRLGHTYVTSTAELSTSSQRQTELRESVWSLIMQAGYWRSCNAEGWRDLLEAEGNCWHLETMRLCSKCWSSAMGMREMCADGWGWSREKGDSTPGLRLRGLIALCHESRVLSWVNEILELRLWI